MGYFDSSRQAFFSQWSNNTIRVSFGRHWLLEAGIQVTTRCFTVDAQNHITARIRLQVTSKRLVFQYGRVACRMGVRHFATEKLKSFFVECSDLCCHVVIRAGSFSSPGGLQIGKSIANGKLDIFDDGVESGVLIGGDLVGDRRLDIVFAILALLAFS